MSPEIRDRVTALPIWFFSPVYFDVASFLILRAEILREIGGLPVPLAAVLVVIDDSGGTDPEIDRLRRLPDVRVLTPPFNLGHQRALVFGLRQTEPEMAAGDLVVTLDGDGEDRAEDLPRLLAPLLSTPSRTGRVVLAARTTREVTPIFQILYFFFKVLFRSLTGVVIRTGNFAAYHACTVSQVLFHPHFDLCYSASLVSLNLDITYVPCARGQRYAGRSKMGYLKLIGHGLSMLMPFLDRIAVRAFVCFSAMFAASAGLSLAVALAVVFGGSALQPPWWTPVALVGLISLSFVALGNFLVLFATYAQSRSSALSSIDSVPRRRMS